MKRKEINGNPVRWKANLSTALHPKGYPKDGSLERTVSFLISVSDEGDEEYEKFWVTCVGENGRLMAGEMCYSLDSAKKFPILEFDLTDLDWIPVLTTPPARID